jgi:hypothetical protein
MSKRIRVINVPDGELDMFTKHGVTAIRMGSTRYNLVKSPVLSYEELEAMSLELNDWMTTFQEDGESMNCALLSAHDKMKEKYGEDKYNQLNRWIEEGSSGPYG